MGSAMAKSASGNALEERGEIPVVRLEADGSEASRQEFATLIDEVVQLAQIQPPLIPLSQDQQTDTSGGDAS